MTCIGRNERFLHHGDRPQVADGAATERQDSAHDAEGSMATAQPTKKPTLTAIQPISKPAIW